MRRRVLGLLMFLLVAVAVAAGVYFAAQLGDGGTAAEEQGELATLTPAGTVAPVPTPSPYVGATPGIPTPPVEVGLPRGVPPPPVPSPPPPTPPWLETPTPYPSPGEQLRAFLDRLPANRKLVISEDIVAVKGFNVWPEDFAPERYDPARLFSPENVVCGIHHITGDSNIAVDWQGREIRRSVGTAGSVPGAQAIAELERVLTDPALFARLVDFLKQPLDPCDIYGALPGVCP